MASLKNPKESRIVRDWSMTSLKEKDLIEVRGPLNEHSKLVRKWKKLQLFQRHRVHNEEACRVTNYSFHQSKTLKLREKQQKQPPIHRKTCTKSQAWYRERALHPTFCQQIISEWEPLHSGVPVWAATTPPALIHLHLSAAVPCQLCGKLCSSSFGLQAHMSKHKHWHWLSHLRTTKDYHYTQMTDTAFLTKHSPCSNHCNCSSTLHLLTHKATLGRNAYTWNEITQANKLQPSHTKEAR